MKVLKVYEYAKCTTCIKAVKFLTNARFALDRVDIFTTPPTEAEMRRMIGYEGSVKKLFNTAGHVYKDSGLSTKLPKMTEDEAIALLLANGRLVKRPFVLWEDGGIVGFDPERWKKVFA